MKERPILFNSDMVNAILEGRKVQTRRVCKIQPYQSEYEPENFSWSEITKKQTRGPTGKIIEKGTQVFCSGSRTDFLSKCPYGKVGDQLWVRETWAKKKGSNPESNIFYRADGEDTYKQLPLHYVEREERWRPSIHMPRWASRIQLEITNIRVERLNHISEEDSKKEGIEKCDLGYKNYLVEQGWIHSDPHCLTMAKASFQTLWESINGQGSWDQNPWIWVIEFKRV